MGCVNSHAGITQPRVHVLYDPSMYRLALHLKPANISLQIGDFTEFTLIGIVVISNETPDCFCAKCKMWRKWQSTNLWPLLHPSSRTRIYAGIIHNGREEAYSSFLPYILIDGPWENGIALPVWREHLCRWEQRWLRDSRQTSLTDSHDRKDTWRTDADGKCVQQEVANRRDYQG